MNISENTPADTQKKRLIPYRKKDKWGYADYDTKEIIIPCIYDSASLFQYGRAVVMLQNKFGVIDMSGQEILPIIYGNPPKIYEEGIILDEIENNQFIDNTLFDLNGKILIPFAYPNQNLRHFFLKHISDQEKRQLFFDNNGKMMVPRNYLGMDDNGIYTHGAKWITEKGEVFTLPHGWSFGETFQEGLISVIDIRNLRYGFMNLSKELVIPLELEFTDSGQFYWGWDEGFHDGLVMARKAGKIGFINKQNELVIPYLYDDNEWGYDFKNGFCVIAKDNKFGVIDTEGKVIIPFVYEYGGICQWTKKRWIIHENSKYSVLNEAAQVVIPDDTYDSIAPFVPHNHSGYSPELARVSKDGLYGFINEEGKEIIPLIYAETSGMVYDLIPAKKDEYYGIIDKNGNTIIPFKYPKYLHIKKDGLFVDYTLGYVDITGFEYWEEN
ncbi:WG repeat-containing protein [Emticicia sp. C21]|uniref:WG repeat-containing protein n=1 Tax=Emticicia sp. C21 TaxID=2302915 RepID=UPI000E34F4ED|nr:WG repeat-containing protein [Emticicia sp. C21]RFS17082.1 WG repeat-containing protein [Emticicia sp. C21]